MKAFWRWLKDLYWREGRLRWLSAGITAVLLALTAGGIVLYSVLHQQYIAPFEESYTEIEKTPEALGITKMEIPEGITSIALFGIDSRNSDYEGLSDSIMIITVDAENSKIKLVSVMRDSLVLIEGHGYQKINAAYELGGAPLAIKTLNQTFDLTITDYATVDFMGMASIIEAVGGIEAELSEEEVKQTNRNLRELVWAMGAEPVYLEEAGLQTLDGMQAVAYARIRMAATQDGENNDYGRTQRQRYVMEQLFQKALSLDISKYPMLIRTLLPCMETSLGYGDIFDLAGIFLSEDLHFEDARIPVDGAIIDDDFRPKGLGSCVYYDLDYAADLMNAYLYEDISFEEYIEENGYRYHRWYNGNLEETGEEESEADTEEEAEEGGVTEIPVPEESEEEPPETGKEETPEEEESSLESVPEEEETE